ncbi:Crp/Fnr family transcriptional regulator [Methylobacterium oxalidis]|uniref:Crp/Fnr family transcriptional regulator n=1 Tax=Methylobacterium oxalidis TaxID=944322 RepID=A0A512J3C2_9HYPH|nr:Crp/Fnr family transcriptional regulator [Methylobacterium oxalidis]GEP04456.1 Crp/Fnr family transcriptional regulator [Methylobacterium oxalidis]GJE32088.1 Fumarate and nitrate reduction regulatory protein [Methylobacterium oxalidis]GLS62828.1 Crp/Fnr family transcriptional regulator [Methylobacterium oxalidis]
MPSSPDTHSLEMLVRRLESIATLSDEERQAILSLPARTRVLKAGHDIVREGDKPSHCCLILSGWAYRYKLIDQGRRQIFSFHIPGDIPDLQSLHIHTMDHSAATLTESTLAFLPHENLLDLTTRFPSLAAILWRETLIDAAIFREWMVGMGRRTAFERIAHLFCELYLKLQAVGLAQSYRCALPITQIDLGDALGLTNVHVNRVLKEMREQGLITLRGGTLVIESWDELIGACGFDPTYLHLEKRAAA